MQEHLGLCEFWLCERYPSTSPPWPVLGPSRLRADSRGAGGESASGPGRSSLPGAVRGDPLRPELPCNPTFWTWVLERASGVEPRGASRHGVPEPRGRSPGSEVPPWRREPPGPGRPPGEESARSPTPQNPRGWLQQTLCTGGSSRSAGLGALSPSHTGNHASPGLPLRAAAV